MRKLLADTAMLIVLGALLGFTANQRRKSGHIRPFKNSFDKTLRTEVPPREDVTLVPAPVGAAKPAGAESAGRPAEPHAAEIKAAHLEHPFQDISFEEVAALYSDAASADGATVFVDARRADVFAQGHIPGAMHCYPQDASADFERVLSPIETAARVVVYCGGGTCDDSIILCRELIDEFEVPYSKVYLFGGGWTEWTANGMPQEEEPDSEGESP